MQDRLGDLRHLALQLNAVGAVQLRDGPSCVLDRHMLQATNGFDVHVQMGLENGLHHEANGKFMGDVFDKLEVLKNEIANISTSMAKIRLLKQEAVQATSPEQEKRISTELTSLVDKSNQTVFSIKKGLEDLKQENVAFSAKNPNSSVAKMRENMHAAVTRKFREILKNYQSIQTDYKKEVREKASRQVKIVFPEANDDEITKMIDSGDMSSEAAIRMRISGQTHESLTNALSDLQDKYRDIRLLEQSVTELHQMFVDLATLVDAQGELLDQIEFSVNSAKDYTEKGEKELVSARKEQRKAKKMMCWLSVCVVSIGVVLMLVLIIALK